MQLLYSMYLNHTGYSIAAQEYVRAILHVDPTFNIKANFVNQAEPIGVSQNRRQLFSSMNKKSSSFPQTSVWHTIPMLYRRPRGPNKHLGVCLFETMNPPKLWVDAMNAMDGIITASKFNERVFKQSGVNVPITVVPHCFDQMMFNMDVRCSGRYKQVTFLSVGTWKKRKNFETLVKAFYDGFSKKDNVCLLIKTDKPDELKAMVRRVKQQCEWRSKDTAPVYAEEKTHCLFEEIPQIMKKGDIYVSSSLGEGFGLPGLHAMALGMPLITTKFGGVTEYALPDLCTYVEAKQYKNYPAMDGIPQFANCIWPVLKIGDLRDAMRSLFENYPKEQVSSAYNFVHKNFSYESIGRRFIEAIQK